MPSARAKELFLEALAHLPGERTQILTKACDGDMSLRSQVEELLRFHDQAGSFMSRPVEADRTRHAKRNSDDAAVASALSERPGTVIGRYKLLQQIGEGGFGVVYMAEQERPVRRKVALKIIKLGMDTRQVIARFEAERQALAMMDHPHIAKVLDAGATETGRPYFVMELVKGIPITRYCDEEQLPLSDRLGLFLNVCSAVQHAHQKGIIHRDLKPSNILVTLHDGTPVPKVIDFGIAKATEQKLTERTMFTEYGQFIGTPAYMSPEQAEMSGLDVDTRSDIYSLGVLLYELLTSSLPFDPQRLLSAGHAEMARIIKEEEPNRPSTRLRTLGSAADAKASQVTVEADAPSLANAAPPSENRGQRTSSLVSIARMRHTDPQSLVRTLRGDLDWIVMKCLEKDRTRRYETANSLARDVGRFLAGETVSAAPPSTSYRLRKFVRRNRTVVIMAAAITAALVVGLTAATAGLLQARQQRNAAHAAYSSEQAQRQIATQERDRARNYAEELRHELYASKIEKIHRILSTDGLEPVKPLLRECDEELRGWEWDRLHYLADGSTGTVQAARSQIYDLHVSGDGSTFLTASADLVTRLWDSETLELVAEMRDSEAPGQPRGTLSRDGKVVVTSDGKKFDVWDARSGLFQRSFPLARHSLHMLALDASASRLAVGYWDGGFTIHDLSTGALLLEGGEKPSSGRTVAFSRDGTRILSASMSNDVSVCSAVDGRQLWAKRGAAFVLLNAVFSPDDGLVATIGQDSRLWVRKADTGELVYTVATGKGASQAVAFHPDGTIIAVGGLDGLISFFRTSNGERLYSLHGQEVEITAIAFDPSGRFLISAAIDGSVKKWHLGAGGPQVRVGHTHAINSLAFSSDDQHLWVVGGTSRDLQLINVPGLKRLSLDPPMDNPRGVAVSPDGQLAVAGLHSDGTVCTLLSNNLDVLHRWKLPSNQWPTPVFSDNSRWLLVTQKNGELSLFDTLTGRTVWQAGDSREEASIPNPALFSPDGRYVLNGSREGTIRILDIRTGELLRESRVRDAPVGPLVLDSPGKRLFVGGNGKVDVWDWRTGELVMTMTGHAGYVSRLALLPDGSRLISAGADATVRLWDTSSGRQVMVIGRHDGPVAAIAVSQDGATIATGGYDNSLRLWETREPPLEGLDARYERARPTWVGFRSDD